PAALPQFRHLPFAGPLLVGTRASRPDEVWSSVENAMRGFDVGQRPGYWIEYGAVTPTVRAHGRSFDAMSRRCSAIRNSAMERVGKQGFGAERLLFVPLAARTAGWSVAVGPSAEIVDFVPCDAFDVPMQSGRK